jgi:hypothetical protein
MLQGGLEDSYSANDRRIDYLWDMLFNLGTIGEDRGHHQTLGVISVQVERRGYVLYGIHAFHSFIEGSFLGPEDKTIRIRTQTPMN